MSSSRSPKKRNAEIKFAIRIRVKVPEGGFGTQLDDLYSFLTESCGQDGYAICADNQAMTDGRKDAVSIYLHSADDLVALLERFALELLNDRGRPLV